MKTKISKWLIALFMGIGCTLQTVGQTVSDSSVDVKVPPAIVADEVIHTTSDGGTQPEPVDIFLEDPLAAPTREHALTIADLAPDLSLKLYGVRNAQVLEFTLRRDQVVENAALDLVFTPSPALITHLSHLRVYLNDELMGVADVDNEFPGQQIKRTIKLNPLLLTRFNRIRLEFVGHYTDICEDQAHSSLWLDVSRETQVRINQRMLTLANDLSFFPEPFFDEADMLEQEIPFVFGRSPDTETLRAAAILASYFGVQAKWRDVRYPVFYNELPGNHAVVFATNDNRPEFLKDYPLVSEPTVELMSKPDEKHYKLLLILGRDAEDLVMAASALAIGNKVFRGRSVTVGQLHEVKPRKPYDAPNWVPTDRPVYFSELIDYPEQLEVSGLMPRPIDIPLDLPPDLFVWRNSGIPMHIQYRYVSPKSVDESRLTFSLNNRYVDSYPLKHSGEKGTFTNVRLPLRGADDSRTREHLLIPMLTVGTRNQLRFQFSFASTIGSSQRDMCQTTLPVDVHAAIDTNSMIDFSGFHHYINMPNLRAFAGSGFPFSRMADLSETVAVVPSQPNALQVATFLEVIGDMGGQIGYPALRLRVTDDWEKASQEDADILLIGEMPDQIKARPDGNLLLEDMEVTLRQPRSRAKTIRRSNDEFHRSEEHRREAQSEVTVRALAPMAAIVGLESEQFPQRSIVGLLASTDDDYMLLRDALATARDFMEGAVVLIRKSGVYSEVVGSTYHVGHLPWWEKVWYYLADRPVMIAILAFILVILIALILWNVLRLIGRKRLERDA